MILSVTTETTIVSTRTEAMPNQRFEVSEIERFGLRIRMASLVTPTRMPSSGLRKMLTLKTAATAENEAASPASGCRPTLR